MKEAAVASHVILQAAQNGITLWRNNSGVLMNEVNVPVRFGLGNVSKKVNEKVKSSDYIGITPVRITQEMVGKVVGVFTAVETKKSDWKFYNSDKKAIAQKAFHDIVKQNGGIGGFTKSFDDLVRIVNEWYANLKMVQ